MSDGKPEIPEGAIYWDTEAGHRYRREDGKWVRRIEPEQQYGYAAVWALLERVDPAPGTTALVWPAIIAYQAAVDQFRQDIVW